MHDIGRRQFNVLTVGLGVSGLMLRAGANEDPGAEGPKQRNRERAKGLVEPYRAPRQLPRLMASGDLPAWRRSAKAWQWVRIPGSDLSSVRPRTQVPGSLAARVNAWNGLACDGYSGRLFSAANGGHADYAGNEVYEIDLRVDTPGWTILREPTAEHAILKSDYRKKAFHDYYLDGRPASTHTYYALHFLSSRNAIFKFGAGSLWGTGNEANWKIDAFSLGNNDWHPAGTWPDVVDSRHAVIYAPVCTDPTTERVYVAAPGRLCRFDPRTGKIEALAKWIQNSTEVYGCASAVDWERRRVVFFGDGYRRETGGILYDMANDRMSRISFAGEALAEVTRSRGHGAWYDPELGGFLLKTSTSANVILVDPESFALRRLPTHGGEDMPNASNGVQTRWQRVPVLGGYAYYPRNQAGVWFLATS